MGTKKNVCERAPSMCGRCVPPVGREIRFRRHRRRKKKPDADVDDIVRKLVRSKTGTGGLGSHANAFKHFVVAVIRRRDMLGRFGARCQ
jgi:hypothetical protein